MYRRPVLLGSYGMRVRGVRWLDTIACGYAESRVSVFPILPGDFAEADPERRPDEGARPGGAALVMSCGWMDSVPGGDPRGMVG